MKGNFLIVCLFLIFFTAGCLIPGQKTPKKDPERELFREIMVAFENRAYESSITISQQFLSQYPQSKGRDAVLMRMGESFEGLLKQEYEDPVGEGVNEAKARANFLEKYEHYNCWESEKEYLAYNKKVYRNLLEKNPGSHYADEASYNLIPWEKEYDEDPLRINQEISSLEKLLTKYPGTSLRPKILFQMGYRFHLLYEIHSFSHKPFRKNQEKAQESLRQAEYLYRLCLNVPKGSEYSKKALHYLELLKKGTKIYINSQP